MKSIKLSVIKFNKEYDLKIKTEGEVESYIIERVDKFFTRVVYHLIDSSIYKIETLKFEITNKPTKAKNYGSPNHSLTAKYCKDSSGDLGVNYFWKGNRMMKGDSYRIMDMFHEDNGLIEFLECANYNMSSLYFHVKTHYKDYDDYPERD